MTRITFIRHAESTFNSGESTGRNVGLSERGKQQAGVLAGTFDCIILSPMRRAIETYTYSNLKAGAVFMDDVYRENMNHDAANYLDLEPMIQETTEMMLKRVDIGLARLRHIAQNTGYRNIAVISHSGYIYYLSGRIQPQMVMLDNTQSFSFNIGN